MLCLESVSIFAPSRVYFLLTFLSGSVRILFTYFHAEPSRDSLPRAIQLKYQELDQELQDGDITEKGYRKKRMKLVHPYLEAGKN